MSNAINDQIFEWEAAAVGIDREAKMERFRGHLANARAAGLEREAQDMRECAEQLRIILRSNT